MPDINIPLLSEEQLDQNKNALETLENNLKGISMPLKATDRNEPLRPRKGSEQIQKKMISMARSMNFALPGYDLDQIERAQALVSQLQDLTARLRATEKILSDTLLVVNGIAWDGFLNYYRVLSAMAQGRAEIDIKLKPFKEFMAVGSKKSAKNDSSSNASDNDDNN